MRRNSHNRQALVEILNRAAWEYRRQYSWTTKDQNKTVHYANATLHYCIDKKGVNTIKGLKAYKVPFSLLHSLFFSLLLYSLYRPKPKPKFFPSHKGPSGGADLCFNSPQSDASRSCKSTDTGLVCRVGCLFKFPACTGTNYTAWWTGARVCVWTTCPRLNVKRHTSTFRLQVRRPNHYATAIIRTDNRRKTRRKIVNEKGQQGTSLKPGFHYPSWRPELTGDRFPLPVNTVLTGNGNRA